MTIASRLRTVGAKATTIAVALAAAFGLSVVAASPAHAANRDVLRADNTGACEWDAVGFWVQRCDVWSPSMNRNIPVLVQPAARGGNAGLYLLDGMRAGETFTGWTASTNAPQVYADSNINLVMPIGGAGSFYADWDYPAHFLSTGSGNDVVYKWETFLTSELPGYLQQNFGIAPNNNSIGGLSMGGTAALSLAAQHPDQFRQAMSYSGYLHTTAFGMQTMLRLALLDVGGFNLNNMYTSILNPRRYQDDPYLNMGGLKNADVYVSAASGVWAPSDLRYPLDQRIYGSGLEGLSRMSTVSWEAKARATGLNVTADYPPLGVHNWDQWTYQLNRTKDRVLDHMTAR